jgi:hypothetical protein
MNWRCDMKIPQAVAGSKIVHLDRKRKLGWIRGDILWQGCDIYGYFWIISGYLGSFGDLSRIILGYLGYFWERFVIVF